ncbi:MULTISPECIES: exonuclease domain-containing protein [Mycobacterium]|uniref:3'-5' exonuclease n=1 Tax=Mycobacterium TaxID=1763 RepID=UPI000A7CD62D|nr:MULTISPECIES: exonuclease domain-containing protein [Mycobacterium]MDP7732128.1 exonuclease domain-containing protein [Mycobacterium sp. TY813]
MGGGVVTRQLVVCDVETTGLTPGLHLPIEVAAVNVTTGEELHFVPKVPKGTFDNAADEALQINRYFERGLFKQRPEMWEATDGDYCNLWMMLSGNTFAGSNPAFDATMVTAGFSAVRDRGERGLTRMPFVREPWHHRLADLAAYAGPALLLAPNELVGLAQICERLGVKNEDEHTALGDARAAAKCFRILTEHYGKRMEPVK